jgi:hypothetical protein
MAVKMWIVVFSIVPPCSLVAGNQHYGETYHLHRVCINPFHNPSSLQLD